LQVAPRPPPTAEAVSGCFPVARGAADHFLRDETLGEEILTGKRIWRESLATVAPTNAVSHTGPGRTSPGPRKVCNRALSRYVTRR